MSKTAQVLTIVRDELKAAEGDTIPKDELIGTIDSLIKTLPQAQAMDESQLDIFITYMNSLNAKVDLLFNATVLCGLGLSNDLKTRATIKTLSNQMNTVQAKFDRDLLKIVDPEAAAEADKKDADIQKAAANAMPGGKRG